MDEPLFANIRQFCVVVRSLEESMRRFSDRFGIGPWVGFHFDQSTMADTLYYGQAEPFAMDIGISRIGGVEIELIEPVAGRSIYADFLEEHGEGLHHVCFDTPDYERACETLVSAGCPQALAGRFLGPTEEDYQLFSYYDCREQIGFYLELYKVVGDFEGLDLSFDPGIEPGERAGAVFSDTRQVSMAVDDLGSCRRFFEDVLGVGPWELFRFNGDVVSDMFYEGRRVDHEMDIAVAKAGEADIEILQPRTPNNTYYDHIARHGKGLQHICFEVEDFRATERILLAEGCPKVQEGTVAGGTYYAYYDCREALGFYVELYVSETGEARFDLEKVGM